MEGFVTREHASVFEHHGAPDDRCQRAARKGRAVERRVLPLRMKQPRVDRPRPVGEHRHVADAPDGERTARHAEDACRVDAVQFDHARERHVGQRGRVRAERDFETAEADRRIAEQLRLLVEPVRCVIGGEHVDRAVAHAGQQRLAVALGAQRRVDFRIGAIVVEAIVEQQQMVRRDLAGRAHAAAARPAHQIERGRGRHVRDVPRLAGIFGDQQIARDDDVFGKPRAAGQSEAGCGSAFVHHRVALERCVFAVRNEDRVEVARVAGGVAQHERVARPSSRRR